MPYPIDVSGVAAFAAFGLRTLRAGYVGNFLTLRRVSDGAQQGFGAVTGGTRIDTAQIAAWLGIPDTVKGWEDAADRGNVAQVLAWIDQSGGTARDLAPAVAVASGPQAIFRRDVSGSPVVLIPPQNHLGNNWGTLQRPCTMATCGYHFEPAWFLPGITDIYAGSTATTMAPYNMYGGTNLVGAVTSNAGYTGDILGGRHTGIGHFAAGGVGTFNFDGTESTNNSAGTALPQNGLQLNSLTSAAAGARRTYTAVHEYIVWANPGLGTDTIRNAVSADIRADYPSAPIALDVPSGSVFFDDY